MRKKPKGPKGPTDQVSMDLMNYPPGSKKHDLALAKSKKAYDDAKAASLAKSK